MEKSNGDEVLARLTSVFPEPPSDASVRTQTVKFFPDHWVKRLPDHVEPPRFLSDAGQAAVSRQDLLDGASDVCDEASALQHFIHVCAWGAGSKARSVARCAVALRDPAAGKKLLAAHREARRGDAVAAYRLMNWGGDSKIKGLGPAFFTKWLYFSGFESASTMGGIPPLILDARVAKALSWAQRNGWSAADYRAYLDEAELIRQAWCPQEPVHVVEYALFCIGG